jgi:hypothetical protein
MWGPRLRLLNGSCRRDTSIYIAKGHAYCDSAESVLVTDKRGERLKPALREGDWLPITELGSKALYQVSAKRFIAVTPYR